MQKYEDGIINWIDRCDVNDMCNKAEGNHPFLCSEGYDWDRDTGLFFVFITFLHPLNKLKFR